MMARFPLAGLLRLRKLQEDQAAGELSRARSRAGENSARQKAARGLLGETDADVASVEAVLALSAARASSASMLADLDALDRLHQRAVEEARLAHETARARALGLEKLEVRSAEESAALGIRAEQHLIDELAGRAWHIDSRETRA